MSFFDLLKDQTGKLSWNRCAASLIIVVVLVAFLAGVKIPPEIKDILTALLVTNAGTTGVAAVGHSIGRGLAQKKSPPPPSDLTTTPPPKDAK